MTKTINTAAATAQFANFSADAINAELVARGLEATDDSKVGAMLLATGCRSLDEFAATIVNLSEGAIDSETMRSAMEAAFPAHKIGDRHGSHYLSLARNGNLQGNVECRFAPPKAARKARAKKGVAIDLSEMDEKQRAMLAKVSPELKAAVEAWEAKAAAAE